MHILSDPQEIASLTIAELASRLPMAAVVGVPSSYRVPASRLLVEHDGDDSDPVIRWDGPPGRLVEQSPSEVLRVLAGASFASIEEVAAFAERYGPYFGPRLGLSPEDDVSTAWDAYAESQGIAEDHAAALSALVSGFVVGEYDGVRVSEVLAGVERVLSLARMSRVLVDHELIGQGERSLPERVLEPTQDDPGVRQALARIEARLVVSMLDGRSGSSGPVLMALPRGQGILAYAELGVLQLVAERSLLRKCARPRCSEFFLQEDRRRRLYCSPNSQGESCKALYDAERKQSRRSGRR